MGANNGTGQPNWFRCSKCRSTTRGGKGGWVGDVELTGKQRVHRGKAGARNTFIDREYVCGSCGHRGWSCHFALAHKAREHEDAQLKDGKHVLPSWVKEVDG